MAKENQLLHLPIQVGSAQGQSKSKYQLGKFIKTMKSSYQGRGSTWFDELDDNLDKWPHWTVITNKDNEDIIAFSAVQTHNFPENIVRVFSRYFISPKYRQHAGWGGYRRAIRDDVETGYGHNFSVIFFKDQMNYITENLDPSHIIFSKELSRRRFLIKYIADNLNKECGTNFKMLDGLYQTYPGAPDDEGQWQVVAAHQVKEGYPFNLSRKN